MSNIEFNMRALYHIWHFLPFAKYQKPDEVYESKRAVVDDHKSRMRPRDTMTESCVREWKNKWRLVKILMSRYIDKDM